MTHIIHSRNLFIDTSSDSTLSSNILGCFQMDHEYVHYDLLGDEHFLNLRSKNLSHMKLFLTDRKNRLLTHAVSSGSDNQSTFGNLSFTAIIRLDVNNELSHRDT